MVGLDVKDEKLEVPAQEGRKRRRNLCETERGLVELANGLCAGVDAPECLEGREGDSDDPVEGSADRCGIREAFDRIHHELAAHRVLATEVVDLLRDALQFIFREEPRTDLLDGSLKIVGGLDGNPLVLAKELSAIPRGEEIRLRRSERKQQDVGLERIRQQRGLVGHGRDPQLPEERASANFGIARIAADGVGSDRDGSLEDRGVGGEIAPEFVRRDAVIPLRPAKERDQGTSWRAASSDKQEAEEEGASLRALLSALHLGSSLLATDRPCLPWRAGRPPHAFRTSPEAEAPFVRASIKIER